MTEREHVLIVDDDPDVVAILERVLRKHGYDTTTAASGSEALKLVGEQTFSVAIVDNRLGDAEGVELIKPFKQASSDLSVIIVTGHTSFETALQAINFGASALVAKPIDFDQLLAKIGECTLNQRLFRQNRLLYEAARRELSERTRAEEALRESNELLERVFNNTYILIAHLDRKFTFIRVNRAYADAGGHPMEFFPGKSHFDLYPHEKNETIFREVVRTGEQYFAFENGLVSNKANEATFWDWSLQPIKNDAGKVEELVLCLLDVTRRKHVQEELRSLAAQLSHAEETERRRIAAALHDYIGQSLALSQIMLGALKAEAPGQEFSGRIDDVRELIDRSLEDTRSLIFQLSPPVLYEVGLEAALERLAEETQNRHGVRMRFRDDRRRQDIDETTRVVLFQAARELVINAVRHADAGEIRVSVRHIDGSIQITVADNGCGFDTTHAPRIQHDGGFGLYNISERLDRLGGRLELLSRPGKGTTCKLVAPASAAITKKE